MRLVAYSHMHHYCTYTHTQLFRGQQQCHALCTKRMAEESCSPPTSPTSPTFPRSCITQTAQVRITPQVSKTADLLLSKALKLVKFKALFEAVHLSRPDLLAHGQNRFVEQKKSFLPVLMYIYIFCTSTLEVCVCVCVVCVSVCVRVCLRVRTCVCVCVRA